jgi:hypothetical protein
MYLAGPSFTVQVKSNTQPLEFAKSHELAWIRQQENPFFVAIGDRNNLRIDLYSTWRRLNGILQADAGRIVFKFAPPLAGKPHVCTAQDRSLQTIYLDKPVISASVHEVMNEKRAMHLRSVLRQWVEIDRENIIHERAGMYWVIGPERYDTNERFAPGTKLIAWIHWKAKNLRLCERNFGRTATALRLTASAASEGHGNLSQDKIVALEAVLRVYNDILDPPSRKALVERIGMNFDKKGD